MYDFSAKKEPSGSEEKKDKEKEKEKRRPNKANVYRSKDRLTGNEFSRSFGKMTLLLFKDHSNLS